MNFIGFLLTLLISGAPVAFLAMEIGSFRWASSTADPSVSLVKKRWSLVSYWVLSILLWLIWGTYTIGLVDYYTSTNSWIWLYILLAYLWAAFIVRIGGRLTTLKIDGDLEKAKVTNEFRLFLFLIVAVFLFVIILPDKLPIPLSWFKGWVFSA